MKLTELNPKLSESGRLTFDCPGANCQGDKTHKIGIPIKPPSTDERSWAATGNYPDTLSLTPSILVSGATTHCWHGYITNGEIVTV